MIYPTERQIEIPRALKLLEDHREVLEVGNVLRHHRQELKHTVVDLYESGEGIIQKDICEFNFKRKFDLVLSISTIEHVGFEYDDDRLRRAAANLWRHTADGGTLFVSFPLGYNGALQKLIDEDLINFDRKECYRRSDYLEPWEPCDWEAAIKMGYGKAALAVALCYREA